MDKFIGKKELEYILYGTCFLGSGGGGSMDLGQIVINNFQGKIKMVDPENTIPEKSGAAIGGIGAPNDANLSKVEFNLNFINSLKILEMQVGKEKNKNDFKFDYVFATELGAASTFAPLITALILNLELVDGDCAGRAVPRLNLTTVPSSNASNFPLVLVNYTENAKEQTKVIIYNNNAEETDHMARKILNSDSFNGIGVFSCWPVNGGTEMSKAIIPGTISKAMKIGKILLESENKVNDLFKYLNSSEYAYYDDKSPNAYFLIKDAEIYQIESRTQDGFDFGKVVLRNDQNEILAIYFQNENMIAFKNDDKVPIAVAPDSICYITTQGVPFSNSDLDKFRQKSKNINVIGIRANEKMRAPSLLSSFEKILRDFNYNGPYVKIEERCKIEII